MSNWDIRWKQRFSNYRKTLTQLGEALELSHKRSLSDLEEQGLIKAFEYTHELAWTTLQDYFKAQGNTQIRGSKDAIREAFKQELITDGETWMETVSSRISTVHTYDEAIAREIADKIINQYYDLFVKLENQLGALRPLT